MKLPDKIVILGCEIKIVEVPLLKDKNGVEVDGLYNGKNSVIQIDSALKGKDKIHTFLHEYGHAVIDIVGIHNCNLSSDLEEIIVDNIGKAIAENFILKFRN